MTLYILVEYVIIKLFHPRNRKEVGMGNVLTPNVKVPRWYIVIFGHFTEVFDFISELEQRLQNQLLFWETAPGSPLDYNSLPADEIEDDELRVTLHIGVDKGTEIEEVIQLLRTERYKHIITEGKGEIKENDDGDNLQNIWRKKSLCRQWFPPTLHKLF